MLHVTTTTTKISIQLSLLLVFPQKNSFNIKPKIHQTISKNSLTYITGSTNQFENKIYDLFEALKKTKRELETRNQ